jgi:hypothetical protein
MAGIPNVETSWSEIIFESIDVADYLSLGRQDIDAFCLEVVLQKIVDFRIVATTQTQHLFSVVYFFDIPYIFSAKS